MSEASDAVLAFIEAVRRGEAGAREDLLTPDVMVHLAHQPLRGRNAALLLIAAAFDAFSDVRLEHEIVSESQSVVVVAFDARGLQQRELLGFEPTGHEARLKGVAVFRHSGSAISEIQLFADLMHVFKVRAAVIERGGDQQAEERAASRNSFTARGIWIAGVGVFGAAEEFGRRFVTAWMERAKAWVPTAPTAPTRAPERDGAASAVSASVPTRQELEALTRRVDALAARLEAREHQVPASNQVSPPARSS
jgi:hypothetical protein